MSGQDDDAGGDTPAAVAEASPPPAPAPVDATPPPSSGAAPVSLDSPMWTETAKNKLENLKRISETRESLAKAKALSLNVVLPANPGAVRAARPVVPPSTDEVEKRKQWAAQQKAFEERRLKLVADREAQAHAEAKAKEEARLAAVRQTVQERLAKQVGRLVLLAVGVFFDVVVKLRRPKRVD